MNSKAHQILPKNDLQISQNPLPHEQIWRPIHYLGSKLRLVESICELAATLDPGHGTTCDLFAGSGTVSMALARTRNVISCDIQEYSRVICTALLHSVSFSEALLASLYQNVESTKLDLAECLAPILDFEDQILHGTENNPDRLCDYVENASFLKISNCTGGLRAALMRTEDLVQKSGHRLLATKYFGGVYFSFRQTLYLDCILSAITQLPSTHQTVALAALLSTASSISNTIGKQFAQPMKPRGKDGAIKTHLLGQIFRDRKLHAGPIYQDWLLKYLNLPESGPHIIIKGDFRDALLKVSNLSLIYADPPYTRDHYSRFYHVLETLALRDFPDIAKGTNTGGHDHSRGLYRKERHQSPFCIKSQAPAAFDTLFHRSKEHRCPLLLSYSPFLKNGHPRLVTVETLKTIAFGHFNSVEILPANPIAHSKLNKTELHREALESGEIFVLCRN